MFRFSVVIDGERGNRPRIYSLEQLLQEAVSFCPQSISAPWEKCGFQDSAEPFYWTLMCVCVFFYYCYYCFFPGVRRSTPDRGHPDWRDSGVCILERALTLSLPRIRPSRWAGHTPTNSALTKSLGFHTQRLVHTCFLCASLRRSRRGGEGR